jgi:predicted DNA binding protein
MSVITEFRIPARNFELGRILTVEGMSSIELESLVPVGTATVPLFWIHNSTRDSFVENVQQHPAVNTAREVDAFEDRTLFTLDWDANQDYLFGGIEEYQGQLLRAVGTAEEWEFELRFPSHDAFNAFTRYCEDAQMSLTPMRVYNPSQSGAGPWYGLTELQRETIILAVEMGYYEIPRSCSTEDLAAELGISDQAVTERLRRAIESLVTYTLLPSESEA